DFGTAGAVKYASESLSDTFIVISGDVVTNFDLKRIVNFHKERECVATIALTHVEDPLQFGIVMTDKDDRIVKFLEKPGWDEVFSNTINTGIYVLEPEVLDVIPRGEPFDFSKNLFPFLLEKGAPLYGVVSDGYWYDVGNPEMYLRVNMDVLNGSMDLPLSGSALKFGDSVVFMEEGVKIGSGVAFLGRVVIGRGSEIRDQSYIRNAIIGENCVVHRGAIVGDSVLWDDVNIGEYTQAEGCIVCNGVRVGRGAVLRKSVVLGDGAVVGDEAYVKEGIKVWPNRVVDSNAILSDNLVWMERWKKSIFSAGKVCGITNVELTPELSAKLGVAYGTVLLSGNTIAAGRDSHKASRVLKRSFIGGVASTGVHTVDFHGLPLPLFRYGITSKGLKGGIYFKQVIDDPLSTEVFFVDKGGVEISSSMEKGIERIFFREDFRRAPYSMPGSITPMDDVLTEYQSMLLRRIDVESIRNRRFRLVVDYSHGTVSPTLAPILRRLRCDVVNIDAYPEDENLINPEASERREQYFRSIVNMLDVDMGFSVGIWGETLSLMDKDGYLYQGVDMLLVMVYLASLVYDSAVFVVPVVAPKMVDEIVSSANIRVKREKHVSRALLQSSFDTGVVFVGDLDGRFVFTEFQHAYDAIYSAVKIMEIIASVDVDFSAFREKLREVDFRHITVPCEWREKGNVMTKASEELRSMGRVSLVDGVKVELDEMWMALVPDDTKPLIHIYAEGRDKAKLHAAIEELKRKVSRWKEG
ncbi:MAG: hypothetical protein J7L41_02885, partial [Synergistetes bacterium]|nr:hypothetical protein [Synergistota bacterium]